MRVPSTMPARVRVYVNCRQPRLGVEQRVPDLLGNAVTLVHGQVLIDDDVQLHLEPVP